MTKILMSAAFAAAVMMGSTQANADAHGGYVIEVPRNLCPELVNELARWAVGKKQYTAFAVPTSLDRNAKCGDKGPRVTAGIATSPKRHEARKAALDVCNANRGELGRCAVVGTVRLK